MLSRVGRRWPGKPSVRRCRLGTDMEAVREGALQKSRKGIPGRGNSGAGGCAWHVHATARRPERLGRKVQGRECEGLKSERSGEGRGC